MIILEENFKWHLEAFASELFIYTRFFARMINEGHCHYPQYIVEFLYCNILWHNIVTSLK